MLAEKRQVRLLGCEWTECMLDKLKRERERNCRLRMLQTYDEKFPLSSVALWKATIDHADTFCPRSQLSVRVRVKE